MNNLGSIQIRRPNKNGVMDDPAENWLAFRKLRFAQAGDGEYVVIRQLDLSGYDLNHFPADHIAFVQCNLDGASFRSTHLSFETAFINCSMKNVDFGSTAAGDALFLDCDLTGAKFWAQTGWAMIDQEQKTIPSIFSDCKLDPETEKFLVDDGCLTEKSKLNPKERLELAGSINDKLLRIVTAPILDL